MSYYKMQPIDAQGWTPYMLLEHLKAEVGRKIESLEAELTTARGFGNGRREKPFHYEVVAGAKREALLDVLAVLAGEPGTH